MTLHCRAPGRRSRTSIADVDRGLALTLNCHSLSCSNLSPFYTVNVARGTGDAALVCRGNRTWSLSLRVDAFET